jgi:hypothetical protein
VQAPQPAQFRLPVANGSCLKRNFGSSLSQTLAAFHQILMEAAYHALKLSLQTFL